MKGFGVEVVAIPSVLKLPNYERFKLDKYIRLLIIPYAVKEINSNPEILPNVTLGFHIYDSCRVLQRELDGTLRIITGQKKAIPNYQCRQREQLAAVIGHSTSTFSILMAHILGLTRYPQISHYMKKVQVEMGNGIALSFDDNGDPPPVYDIVNWQLSPEGTIRQVKVGTYYSTAATKHVLMINTSDVQWSSDNHTVPISICNKNCSPGFRKAAKKGEPSCCYECVICSQGEISNQTDSTECFKCPWNKWPSQEKDRCLPKTIDYLKYEEPLGITLTATSVTSSFVPLAILGLLISYKATPVVRANNYTVSCLLLICLSLCFLCSLAFIGYPQREKCLLRQVAFGMIFSLCVSCILAKTIMVTIAFRATRPNSDLKKWAGPHVSCKVISLGTFLQFLICVTWLAHSPPFPEYSYKPTSGVLILQCNEGSTTAFWCTLGYLSVLALISCLVAFLVRQLPDSYNEAKFITFSMIAFLSVWLSFIPAHISTSGRYTVAMEIFAILSSSWAMLCCMFMPKCYIILFRPTANSRKHLMRRFSSRK
ncbi:vomeronasal type-2 receptor 26-like [Mixophyes fleayi]|uniref:vomeronasal type-2 receptor 26-like n=1 Tax=Mixophyes fleayi TaxID=3061075 RepID=UPI003F4DE263